jgi:hypothetical protein
LLKVKGWRKIYYANSNKKTVEIAIVISKQDTKQGKLLEMKRGIR